MPDWRRLVRRQLGELELPAGREGEVVEELAQILHDACADAGVDLEDDAAVERWVASQGPWPELTAALRCGERRWRRHRPRRRPPERSFMNFGLGLGADLKSSLRQLVASPQVSLTAVLTLAVAIGLNSTIFSLVDAVMLRPPPVEEPQGLVRVYSSEPDGFMPEEPMSYPDLADLSAASDTLDEVFGHTMTQVALEWQGRSELVFGELVTGGYFPALGLKPAVGRLLGPGEDRLGDPAPVAVLGHALWRSRFGADPAVVGRTVRVNGQPLTILGVAPAGYRGLLRGLTPQLWLPATLAERISSDSMTNAGSTSDGLDRYHDRARRWLWVAGRRAPGASLEAVRSEVDAVATRLAAEYPDSNRDRTFAVLPLTDVKVLPFVDRGIRLASAVLFTVVGLVLLLACANLANIMLARVMGRRRELATRLSLGATRWRLARQLFTESLLLALAGGALGLLLAFAARRLFNQLHLGGFDFSLGLQLDGRVLLFTLLISVVAALFFGLLPVLETVRPQIASVLRDGSGRGTSPRRRLQSALVALQVGLTTVLLVLGGLALRSLLNASRIDPGFDSEGVAVLRLDLGLQGYDTERATALFNELERQAATLPGVESVAQASHLPLSLWINTWTLSPATGPAAGEEGDYEVDLASVGPGYFETLDIELLEGRGFERWDRPDTQPVMVVNSELARRFWPGETALGKQLTSGDERFEVVGVVQTGRYRTLGEAPRPFAYVSFGQRPGTGRNLLVRFTSPKALRLEPLRRLVQRADPYLAISDLSPAETVIRPALILPQAGSALFGSLGLLGLALASLGLYGVLSYSVSRRVTEIGVRLAMGAERRDILGLILRQGMVLTAGGALAGLAVAALLSRLLRTFLFGISPLDPGTYAVVTGVFLAVAALACYLPARRATAVDPMQALRGE